MSRVLIFMSKMLLNHFPVNSLLTDTMLYGQGGGILTRLYKAALQSAKGWVFCAILVCKLV